MTSTPPVIDKLKSWPSAKRYLQHWDEYERAQQGERILLEEYVVTGNVLRPPPLVDDPDLKAPFPSRDSYLHTALQILSRLRFIEACQPSQAGDVQQLLGRAVLYNELGGMLRVLVESEFPVRFGRNLRMLDVGHAGWIGLAAGAGATEILDRWALLMVQALRNGYVLAYNQKGMQHFILRLWCAARGQDYPQTGYPTYDVAEGILQMWDTADIESLGRWLVQLCNQHTRLTGTREFMDFANQFSHCPVEVMMLFRLREQRGLENPEVDHPLMKFPWSQLWPVQSVEPDELLAGVYRRLEQDEGVTVQSLYQQLLPV